MKNNLYFENVVEVGNLYLEHIFLEFCKEPVFFTCVDKEQKIYICLCSEIRGEQRWIISKCDIEILEKLVDGDIDMSSTFYMESKVYIIIRDVEGQEISCCVFKENIDPLDLPEKGTLLKCNQMKAMNYLINKKFEAPLNFKNNIMEKFSVEMEREVYNTVFKTEHVVYVDEGDALQNILAKFLVEKQSVALEEYTTSEDTVYQNDIGLNDVEDIDNEYYFAA